MWYQKEHEIYLDRMVAPVEVEAGEQAPIRLMVHSQKQASGTIDLYHNGSKVDLPPEYRHVELAPGNNAFIVKLLIDEPGLHRFEAVFNPDTPQMDTEVDNNRASSFSVVSGRGISGNLPRSRK